MLKNKWSNGLEIKTSRKHGIIDQQYGAVDEDDAEYSKGNFKNCPNIPVSVQIGPVSVQIGPKPVQI